ncbi:MAG TPA: hypothetical protein DCM05_07600 [Elusimicrobia bacterium]|nr:hypothetical protein [Elusimicrobiota bacterium]
MSRIRLAAFLFALLCAALPLLLFAAEMPSSNSAAPGAPIARRGAEEARFPPIHVVVVDPGHGGKDLGALIGGREEKALVFNLALRLQEQLERARGFWARLTRNGDVYLPLAERVDRAQAVGGKALVSLHFDDVRRSRWRGVKVYYYGRFRRIKPRPGERVLPDPPQAQIAESRKLALRIHEALRLNGIPAAAVDRGAFVVLKSPAIPSVLIEAGNLRDPLERSRLEAPAHQETLARAIAQGVQSYLAELPAIAKR